MSGGPRYWNEETQRWEDPGGTAAVSPPTLPDRTPPRPVTPPPPSEAPVPPPWYDPERGTTVPPAPDTATWPSASPVSPALLSSPADPDSAPAAPSRGPGRRLALSVVIGAAAAGVAVSLVLTLVMSDGKGKDKATGTPAATATSAPGATATPSSTPSAADPDASSAATGRSTPAGTPTAPFHGAAQVPAGYQSYEDDQGFRIARPEGWSRTTVASAFGIRVVNYRSPDRRQRLQVYQVEETSPDASFDLFLSDQTVKPAGFRSLSRENLDTTDFTGTRLEWTAARIKGEPDAGTWHVYDERFVAPDGNIYAIAAYGPDTRTGRTQGLQHLTTALTWFCPAGSSCETPQD